MIRRLALVLALGLPVSALTGCLSPRPGAQGGGVAGGPESAPRLVTFGEPYATSEGQVFVLRIQNEYRVIRCVPTGPIAGCYEDVLSVPGHDVRWNEWLEVGDVPGLQVAFISPTARSSPTITARETMFSDAISSI